ncbi:FAD-dependent monooxygenase [Streptomyces sp. NPDC127190]|uniref:FAD-dependent monooxygenase n=1 Tax=unclassified Streptomyces TaxID=2593676 RepID=UPI003630AF9D
MTQTEDRPLALDHPGPVDRPVLVVGAGPVGLTAATELLRREVPVRCVDRAPGPSPLSKALAVWPRTLELLRRLGGAARIEQYGLPIESLRYHSLGREVARVRFTERTRPVTLPQNDVETLLAESLAGVGGKVEWGTELVALDQRPDRVYATLRGPDGTELREEFSYVIGSDGASSTVRKLLGIPFEGSTYENLFALADVRIEGPLVPDANYYFCGPKGIVVLVGMPGGRFRVFTAAPPGTDREDVDLALIQRLVDERCPGGLRLLDPTWTAGFAVHARHAGRTREGRIFLAGDAAHIHSPAGGQGLNTGVQDAHNLAWKIALAHSGRAGDPLLDSYAGEREQVAKTVIRQADLQTRAWTPKKRSQIVLRDAALRTASALRLFGLGYVPGLAGLTTVYREGAAVGPAGRSGGFTTGALVPDRPVWDERTQQRTPLRLALDDLRLTLLVTAPSDTAVPDAALTLAGELGSRYGDLIDVRYLDTTRQELTDTPPATPYLRRDDRRVTLALTRPDGYVAVCGTAEAPHLIRDWLRTALV